jgi:hypothetical protein
MAAGRAYRDDVPPEPGRMEKRMHRVEVKTLGQALMTKTDLKSRGWTDALIARFFPTPTTESPNPYYRAGAPVKLYDAAQVAAIESTAAFQEAQSAAAKRSQSAKARAARRHATTLQWLTELPPPHIPRYSQDTLYRRACQHYNDLWRGRGDWERHADRSASDDFLNRIAVNFLRHALSPYEERLVQSRGRIGASEARRMIRQQILSAIAQIYPWLAEECAKQTYRDVEPDVTP